ncbi:MAG: hypothetical protein A3F82_08925 [Deltaproteobacteria bacterium RIFCSPLOWO2_12_FULL_44_12]|nr:MAG: hypothetical protein A3D22_09905 [Deltaproteobacteria bacterium RIFCSPHIGHO2_02_FULL_44_53]OGQ27422.1 MAG: hypothetical protein A3D98_03505 [Deltaproteobacteria bacterium RIFCSPHIGHO2_12_FULL_44_21]OGQ30670.1 MAG: hypothetical protein A2979_05930 [Deltaproteobacteria bacterium RIFCSPLOWO2_01_FULL_45_74]OGQ42348.1 MAG: hypothetical protein A3I70_02420 [Deltaproteobacteria bacterium RIFCSPLOWO2_02_FULL_44_34]OGQ69233.1 MAG: hypothetical protein A3F82_08925 [Deltaproteobacteria bacterium R
MKRLSLASILHKLVSSWLPVARQGQGTLSKWGFHPHFALSLDDVFLNNPHKVNIVCEKPLTLPFATPRRKQAFFKNDSSFTPFQSLKKRTLFGVSICSPIARGQEGV